jgi:hypothetical protein
MSKWCPTGSREIAFELYDSPWRVKKEFERLVDWCNSNGYQVCNIISNGQSRGDEPIQIEYINYNEAENYSFNKSEFEPLKGGISFLAAVFLSTSVLVHFKLEFCTE